MLLRENSNSQVLEKPENILSGKPRKNYHAVMRSYQIISPSTHVLFNPG
jgi:hypothetical protein